MPASHTSSMDNNTGSQGSWSASRPAPDEKPSRDVRLDKFKSDKDYDLAHRVHSGEQRPSSLDEMLGQHLNNLPQTTTNGN
ncbi:hypothetical protein CGRA01v4_04731 [Colletotrichum graminicola]|uniref:Uncharacterized protein n=1 Tax=Colletotrichum graminicola (strain M1.001 / M2 / FGSC 10212) TaxID=645133 RepID=E3QLH8_COLGM|nr:uncharacterized protein GLRG_06691 [Colletotrichum graminicola M1.001]EFQ31716.1 hypothetical protein GLRG_06691 [Colletotrichum graminicola M1.001]WDK13450.1 hypothetical protein CGRA01v4_04731 [Colletotrichum graminicola]